MFPHDGLTYEALLADADLRMYRDKAMRRGRLSILPAAPLDPDPAVSGTAIEHLCRVIRAAAMLGLKNVNTFVGRDWRLSIDENWPRFLEVWRPRRQLGRDVPSFRSQPPALADLKILQIVSAFDIPDQSKIDATERRRTIGSRPAFATRHRSPLPLRRRLRPSNSSMRAVMRSVRSRWKVSSGT